MNSAVAAINVLAELAQAPGQHRDPVSDRYQGGPFCSDEYDRID